MTQTSLPAARAAFIDQSGRPTPQFYRFLETLATAQAANPDSADIAAINAQLAAIQAEIDALPEGGSYPILRVLAPLTSQGLLQNGFAKIGVFTANSVDASTGKLTLLNDAAAPGNTWFYGTDTTGAKGWQALSGVLHDSARVAVTFAADGTATFDLKTLADSGAGTFKLLTRDAYGRLAGTKDGTTSDVPEGTNLYYTDTRADARITAQKGQPNGLATLGADSKLDSGQLPALAITDTFVVSTEAAMLALAAQQGDVCVRTDLHDSFILTTNDPTVLVNWQELETPVDGVSSFNGRTGSVTPATNDYTFAQIGSKPTTLSGYGITDALKSSNNLSDVASSSTARTNLGVVIPQGYIDGLQMQWVSGTAVTVSSGAAYIPSLGNLLVANAPIALTGLSLTASTWYHLYLYSNAGTPAIECVTTAPSAPYSGTARTKAGDTSRRYVVSVLTDVSGNILQFKHSGQRVTFLRPMDGTGSRVLSNGSAVTATSINLAAIIPLTATHVQMRALSNGSPASRWSNQDIAGASSDSGGGTFHIMSLSSGAQAVLDFPVASNQTILYWLISAGNGVYCDVMGFIFTR